MRFKHTFYSTMTVITAVSRCIYDNVSPEMCSQLCGTLSVLMLIKCVASQASAVYL